LLCGWTLDPGNYPWRQWVYVFTTVQMKGWWESNLNVWFPFMYFLKWNWYFQNRVIMFCLPVPILIYRWEIYTIYFQDRPAYSAAGNMCTVPGNI
jgi:hypothetical protein